MPIDYNTSVLAKINYAKSHRIDYRIVVRGADIEDKSKNNRLTIVIDTNGRLILTYYG
jgi:hypothetical protein